MGTPAELAAWSSSTRCGQYADPVADGIPLDGFVAGDDEEAKAQVLEVLESIGLRPIDAGPLRMARVLEAMAWLTIWLRMDRAGAGRRAGSC